VSQAARASERSLRSSPSTRQPTSSHAPSARRRSSSVSDSTTTIRPWVCLTLVTLAGGYSINAGAAARSAAARSARSRVTWAHGLQRNHRGSAEVSRGGPATSIRPASTASAQVL